MMITFSVDQQADWQPVIAYLFATAEAAPLDHADSDNYSKSKQQFSERMGRILANAPETRDLFRVADEWRCTQPWFSM
jgi:hypothetical protein